ncbi:SusD/RagB family nutrient-binding outer membrane lipoprotein [Salinibacter altiplanensis]|uniref:SusD/RagB family nutrient-binding outer membrane lipoprotein n=1 Tax=Salinibacter altiplanensis TaxID=1803181 RepID=UPI000C9F8067|nr:SusD/RagB family nutrient-binding outer membrane lipoprotein [Salinibacter altiplanensis]
MRRHVTLTLLVAVGLSVLLALGGCDSLTSYNDNPNEAKSANPNNLLANAQRGLADEVYAGTSMMRRSNVWAQYTTQNFYPSESRYSPVNYAWTDFYTRLTDLKAAKQTALERPGTVDNQGNFQAVATIMQAWAFQILTDTYGAVPFEEALQQRENESPVYTDQSVIYPALVDSLNSALDQISTEASGPSGDLVNGGDMMMWQKFANGLKMRIALRGYELDADWGDLQGPEAIISNAVDPTVNGEPLTSNDDNVYFQFGTSANYRNTYYENRVTDGRDDFDGSARFIDFMKTKYNNMADPRLDAYFEQTSDFDQTSVSGRPCEDGSGEYAGFPFALKQGDAQGLYSGSISTCNFSRPEAWFPNGPSGEGDSFAPMMYYDEVLLTKAWAANEGFIPGTPQELIAGAIEASVNFYGNQTDADISGSSSATQNYVSQVQNDFGSDPKQVIGEQRYISFYMHNIQGWSTWRRFDFEGVLGAPTGGVAGGFDSYAPLRVPYPSSEANLNGQNYTDAANKCSGDFQGSGGSEGGAQNEDEDCRVAWDVDGPPSDDAYGVD